MKKHKRKLITLGILFTSAYCHYSYYQSHHCSILYFERYASRIIRTILIGDLVKFIIQNMVRVLPVLLIHDLTGGSAYEWHKIEKICHKTILFTP